MTRGQIVFLLAAALFGGVVSAVSIVVAYAVAHVWSGAGRRDR